MFGFEAWWRARWWEIDCAVRRETQKHSLAPRLQSAALRQSADREHSRSGLSSFWLSQACRSHKAAAHSTEVFGNTSLYIPPPPTLPERLGTSLDGSNC